MQKARFSTGLKLPESNWDKKSRKVKKLIEPRNKSIQNSLDRIESKLQELWWDKHENGITLSPQDLQLEYEISINEKVQKVRTLTDIMEIQLKEYEQRYQMKSIKQSTLKGFQSHVRFFKKFIEDSFATEPSIEHIDSEFLSKYIQYCQDRGDKPKTIEDRRKSKLNITLNYAFEEGFTNKKLSKHLKRVNVDVLRPYLDEEELNYLYEQYEAGNSSKYIRLILLGCFTGLRYDDLQKTDWRQLIDYVDEQPGVIVKIEKQRTKMLLPIPDRAIKILKDCDFKPGFPKDGQTFNRQVKIEFAKHEIFNKPKRDWIMEEDYLISEEFSAHDMRRTYVTILYRKTGDKEVVASFTGHEELKTLELYIQPESNIDKRFMIIKGL